MFALLALWLFCGYAQNVHNVSLFAMDQETTCKGAPLMVVKTGICYRWKNQQFSFFNTGFSILSPDGGKNWGIAFFNDTNTSCDLQFLNGGIFQPPFAPGQCYDIADLQSIAQWVVNGTIFLASLQMN